MSMYLPTSIRLSKLLYVFLLMSLYESILCYPFHIHYLQPQNHDNRSENGYGITTITKKHRASDPIIAKVQYLPVHSHHFALPSR
jgi:hypothetical protein